MDEAQFLQEFLSWFKNRLNKNLHIDEWQRPLLVSLLLQMKDIKKLK